jgi:heme A synthase
MGTVRSMADYYDRYGCASTISLLLIVALLWILSDLAERNARISARILLPVSLFLLFLGIDEGFFFFPLAAALSLLGALLSSFSFLTLSKQELLR